jgi:hypothetical protein
LALSHRQMVINKISRMTTYAKQWWLLAPYCALVLRPHSSVAQRNCCASWAPLQFSWASW